MPLHGKMRTRDWSSTLYRQLSCISALSGASHRERPAYPRALELRNKRNGNTHTSASFKDLILDAIRVCFKRESPQMLNNLFESEFIEWLASMLRPSSSPQPQPRHQSGLIRFKCVRPMEVDKSRCIPEGLRRGESEKLKPRLDELDLICGFSYYLSRL